MGLGRKIRWSLGAALLLALLALLGLGALRAALELVRGQLERALGPGSELRALNVGLATITLEGLRIPGGPGWPTRDALRAERVVIAPALRSLLGGPPTLRRVTLVRPHLSLLRTREGGMRLLPTLLERTDPAAPATPGRVRSGEPAVPELAGPGLTILHIAVEDGSVEIHDASVRKQPWVIRLERIVARADHLVAPGLDAKLSFALSAELRGPERNGQIELGGWLHGGTGDLEAATRLRDADLLALEPYLLRSGEARLRRGRLDLELESRVRERRLRAPGRMVLRDLEFAPGRGALDSVMGLPRAAVTRALADREGRITLAFTLEGDLDDPRFSLNETLATRVAASFAETLGVSVRGLARTVEGVGRSGVEGARRAARGVGTALGRLLGREEPATR